MKVTLLYTIRAEPIVHELLRPLDVETTAPTDADLIGELAGRGCYRSFHRPNEKTRTSQGYHGNIQKQGHYNIYEHVSVPFLVQGVSRHLLGELTRHRFHQFSVESLRYCPPREYAVHPTIAENETVADILDRAWGQALQHYQEMYDIFIHEGRPKKEAREAAAQVLPLSTATDLIVSANLRAWRTVIPLRAAKGANREIRHLAKLFLAPLQQLAPSSMQDVEVDDQ